MYIILYCFCCGMNVYCLPMTYGNLILHSIALPSFVHVGI